jgi:D-serine deaminase-like pyridoxal phosphate-dependent protein
VVAPAKLARVADLAHQLAAEHGQLAIAVDSLEGVRRLANAMNDRRRGGTHAGRDRRVRRDRRRPGPLRRAPGRAAVDLAHEIRKHPALRFAGLQAYHGKAQHLRTPQARRDAIAWWCRTCCSPAS